jgi:hypothetical protein
MEKIQQTVAAWEGVSSHPHRFGGIEFRLGKRELGHLHGNYLLDIPFPWNVRNELVESGRVAPHHILPESGWISFYIRRNEDVDEAIKLLNLSFDIAKEKIRERNH